MMCLLNLLCVAFISANEATAHSLPHVICSGIFFIVAAILWGIKEGVFKK